MIFCAGCITQMIVVVLANNFINLLFIFGSINFHFLAGILLKELFIYLVLI